jgi:hypothetical protein
MRLPADEGRGGGDHRWYAEENADWDAVDNLMTLQGLHAQSFSAEMLQMFRGRFAGGHGVCPLIGSPDDVAAEIKRFWEAGFKGMTLSFVDYVGELDYFAQEVMPRLEQLGCARRAEAGRPGRVPRRHARRRRRAAGRAPPCQQPQVRGARRRWPTGRPRRGRARRAAGRPRQRDDRRLGQSGVRPLRRPRARRGAGHRLSGRGDRAARPDGGALEPAAPDVLARGLRVSPSTGRR